MKRLLAALGVILALTGPTNAQTEAARLAQLMSQDFSRQAIAALQRGDRSAALGLALRGLPDQPTGDDLLAYPDAMFALELAHGARVPRIDRDRNARFSVNSDGTRAFISHWENSARPEQDFPQALIDPRDASLIQTLDPQIDVHGITTPGQAASFSPDGTILAVPTNKTASVHLFAARDGAYLGALLPRTEGKGFGYEVGFSPDGRLYARGYGIPGSAGIHVWDVETRTLVHHLPMSARSQSRQWPLGWDHEGGLLVQTVTRNSAPGAKDQILIQRWGFDETISDLVTEQEHPYDTGGSAFSYPETGLLFLSNDKGVRAVDLATGTIRFSVPEPGAFVALAREGKAVVLRPRRLVPPAQFSVFDLEGNKLEITGRDAVPFMHALFSAQGHRIVESAGIISTTYNGHGAPGELALYDAVWASLPEGERDIIIAERVLRP